MTSSIITAFEKMLGGPRDNALLRYSLGKEWMKCNHPERSIEFLRSAVALDPNYSAAWKLYGKVLSENGDWHAALKAFEQGALVAQNKGDIQAANEMNVFVRRLRKLLEQKKEDT